MKASPAGNGIRGAGAVVLAVGMLIAGSALAQEALEESDIEGVWQGTEVAGQLSVRTTVVFTDKGEYQKTSTLGQLMAWQSGEWAVVENWVHLVPKDYGPKEYMGKPQFPPPGETWVVDHFDGRKLHARIGSMSELTLYRQ